MKVPDARQPEAIRALPRCQRRPGAARSTRETNFTPRRFPPSPERMSVSLVAFERVNRVTQAPLGSAPARPFRLWCGVCAQGRACEESPAADLLGPRGTRCGLARQARSGGSTRESRSRVWPKQDHAWRGGPQAFIGTSPLSQARAPLAARLMWCGSPSTRRVGGPRPGRTGVSSQVFCFRPYPNGPPDAVNVVRLRPDAAGHRVHRRRGAFVSDCRTGREATAGEGPGRG